MTNKPQPIVQSQNRLILSQSERTSSAWNTISEFLRQKIVMLEMKNRGDLDPQQTNKVRGQIALLAELLDAEKDDPVVETSNL